MLYYSYMIPPRSKKPHPVTNAELLVEIARSNEAGQPTRRLCELWILLVDNYARRPNFRGYSWIDDMRSEAMCNLCKHGLKFDTTRSNPFAYYTRCVHNSFLKVIAAEHKLRSVKDAIMIEAGLTPSWHAQDNDDK